MQRSASMSRTQCSKYRHMLKPWHFLTPRHRLLHIMVMTRAIITVRPRTISAPLARFGSLPLIQRLRIAWNLADTLHWIVTGKDPLMLRFARLTAKPSELA